MQQNCSKCGKTCYTTQKEAGEVKNLIKKSSNRHKKIPKRTYKCECGMWCLTSKKNL